MKINNEIRELLIQLLPDDHFAVTNNCTSRRKRNPVNYASAHYEPGDTWLRDVSLHRHQRNYYL